MDEETRNKFVILEGQKQRLALTSDHHQEVLCSTSILSLCMFSVFGNRHGWLIPDNVRLANSFVLPSADWPSDFTAEYAECQNMLTHPRLLIHPRTQIETKTEGRSGYHNPLKTLGPPAKR